MSLLDQVLEKALYFFDDKEYEKSYILLLGSEVLAQEPQMTVSKPDCMVQIECMKGHCMLSLGDDNLAQASFIKVLELKQNNAEAHAGLGYLLWKKGDRKNSEKEFQTAMQIDPLDKFTIVYYSKVLYAEGKLNEALLLCLKYYKSNPANVDIIELLLEYAEIEKKKNENKNIHLTLVTGIHGSGKSTYSESLGVPVFHTDQYFNYATNEMNYRAFRIVKDFSTYFVNDNLPTIVLDGYVLFTDPDFAKLREAIAPIKNIIVNYVYTTGEELYNSQRSTDERKANMAREELPKEEDILWSKKQQIKILRTFEDLLEKNIIAGIKFVFREGNIFTQSTKEHFMDTIGEIVDWSMNKYELLSFVKQNEVQPYQTIEYRGEVIRPGTEQCWLTWQNISKFNINWNDKYVCDIGSYFGYFSLQALKSGAKKVLGVDQNEKLLGVYTEVLKANRFENFETRSILLGNGNNIPEGNYDIVMALNMLHHVKNATTPEYYQQVLESIFKNTKEVVFEINDNQIDQIKETANRSGFLLVSALKSHRNTSFGQRYLLYFSKITK